MMICLAECIFLFKGLEFLTEIQDYNPEKQPYYKCEVCRKDMIESGDVIQHCVGVQHKLRYLVCSFRFKCNDPHREKIGFLSMRKQRHRSASQ